MVGTQVINGVDVEKLGETVKSLSGDPELAKFRFRVRNRWLGGGYNRTTISDFYGARKELSHQAPFSLEADEPPLLVGEDRGPNPVEHLLNALVSCLTTSLVYHAAVRGIVVEEVESTVEGDLDLRGFTGLSQDVRKGYQNIRVTFRVKSDAPVEQLEECARFSPVLDVASNGTNVALVIEKR
jgi:uncharacterized OsmC-like protein